MKRAAGQAARRYQPKEGPEKTMGKKSVKENKNVYQTSREALGLSREAAAEKLVFISPERIERIESGKMVPHPDEVLEMERCYQNPQRPQSWRRARPRRR